MYNIKPVFSLFFFSPIIKNDFLSDFLLCLCPGVGLIIFALEMTNEDLLDYWLIPPWGNASCCCVVYLSFISKGVIITSCFFLCCFNVSPQCIVYTSSILKMIITLGLQSNFGWLMKAQVKIWDPANLIRYQPWLSQFTFSLKNGTDIFGQRKYFYQPLFFSSCCCCVFA